MRKRSVLRILILSGFYSLIANFAHPVEPTFYKQLALPDYMFGVAFASMATMIFLFSPFWNRMSDRFGPNRILSLCYIGYGFGQLYFFFLAKDVLNVVLARFFAGIFISGITVAYIVYILENSSEEDKGKCLANYATINAIFSAFGYLIGGVLGDFSLKFTLGLEVVGLWVMSVMHRLFVEDRERDRSSVNWKELIREANPMKGFYLPKEDRTLTFISFLMVCMLTGFAATCYEQCFNYFIKDQYGFPPSYNGYLKGGVGIITLIANSTICTYLMQKTDIRRSIIYVLIVCLFMMIGIVLIDDIRPFIILNVVFFGFNAVYKPLLQSMLNRFQRRSNRPIVGIYNSISNIGTIVGSLTSGLVYDHSPKGSFLYAAVAFGIAILCSVVQKNSDKEVEIV